jgi:hypothetical protein
VAVVVAVPPLLVVLLLAALPRRPRRRPRRRRRRSPTRTWASASSTKRLPFHREHCKSEASRFFFSKLGTGHVCRVEIGQAWLDGTVSFSRPRWDTLLAFG